MNWTAGWIVILGLGALLEVVALIADRRGTLSETVWRWFDARTGHWTPGRIVLLLGMAWLTVHLVWG